MDRSAPVTIIIPAYLQDEQDLIWLNEAMDSALDQSLVCNIVIVENGSDYFPDLDAGQISIIHSGKGLSTARNAGIRFAQTAFFFPLDCNDWLPDNAIETLLNRYPGSGFVYGSTMLFRNERGQGDQHHYEAKAYDFREVMKMVYFPNGALQKKADWEIIGGYREDLPFLEDWDYWMTAGEKGICGLAIPETTYWYRQHAGIVTTNKGSQEWEDMKRRIQALHKNIYQGRFPEMCCGNKASQVPFVAPVQAALAPGADGMILIEYIGGNTAEMTFFGAITGTRYRAGGVLKRLYIDQRDAVTGLKQKPGFLELNDHGNPIFQLVEGDAE